MQCVSNRSDVIKCTLPLIGLQQKNLMTLECWVSKNLAKICLLIDTDTDHQSLHHHLKCQPSIERAQTFRHPPIIDRDNRRAWPNSAIRVAAFFDQMPNVSNLKLDNKYKVVLSTKLFVGIFALVIEVIGSAIFLASPYWRVSGFPLCFYQSNHLDHHLSTVTFNKSQRCWLYQVA